MNEEMQVVEGVVDIEPSSTGDRLETAMLDVQIVTAKRYPRSVVRFKAECESLATVDQETAASMFYTLKRGSKSIEGPSVRLAEIVANTWGNLHLVARQLEVQKGDKFARSQSVAWDLERNVRVGVEVSRRITGRDGQVYNDDMIGVTQAAALAVAFRNSVFKAVPLAYVKDIYEKCKLASVGKGLTMEQRKAIAVKAFALHKVAEAQLLAYLEKAGWDDVDINDFINLRGLLTAIKDGDITVREAFAAQEKTANLDGILKPELVKAADTPLEKPVEKPAKVYPAAVVTPSKEPAASDDKNVDDLFAK